MPSTSAKQAKFMRAVANNPSFAKKVDVKQAVGKEFEMADKKKMRKFSEGGAQGRYDRRMADIEKDYAKAMTRKTGKAAEVAEAKRQQRIADAKDDFAKRTGADRTATRAAERTAESNLTKTRKYGAPKSVTTEASVSEPKIGNVLAPIKSGLSTPAKKAPVKKPATTVKAATTPKRMGDQGFAYKKKDMPTTGQGVSTHYRYVRGGSNSGAAADGTAAQRLKNKGLETGSKATGATSAALLAPKGSSSRSGSFGDLFKTSDSFRASQERKYGKRTPLISGTDTDSLITYGDAAAKKNAANKAKGGKITNKKPMPMGGKQLMPLKKKLTKEPITGGSDTVPATSERNEFRKEMMKRNATPGMSKGGKMKKYAHGGVTKEMPSSNQMGSLGMAKGGKAKMKPAAKGKAKGNPFAATKFGAAMMKKSADTEGRAMKKFAKGGSIDGCAVKGKTKTSMLARGGAAKMRSRDSYGGAMFKKGGKTC